MQASPSCESSLTKFFKRMRETKRFQTLEIAGAEDLWQNARLLDN